MLNPQEPISAPTLNSFRFGKTNYFSEIETINSGVEPIKMISEKSGLGEKASINPQEEEGNIGEIFQATQEDSSIEKKKESLKSLQEENEQLLRQIEELRANQEFKVKLEREFDHAMDEISQLTDKNEILRKENDEYFDIIEKKNDEIQNLKKKTDFDLHQAREIYLKESHRYKDRISELEYFISQLLGYSFDDKPPTLLEAAIIVHEKFQSSFIDRGICGSSKPSQQAIASDSPVMNQSTTQAFNLSNKKIHKRKEIQIWQNEFLHHEQKPEQSQIIEKYHSEDLKLQSGKKTYRSTGKSEEKNQSIISPFKAEISCESKYCPSLIEKIDVGVQTESLPFACHDSLHLQSSISYPYQSRGRKQSHYEDQPFKETNSNEKITELAQNSVEINRLKKVNLRLHKSNQLLESKIQMMEKELNLFRGLRSSERRQKEIEVSKNQGQNRYSHQITSNFRSEDLLKPANLKDNPFILPQIHPPQNQVRCLNMNTSSYPHQSRFYPQSHQYLLTERMPILNHQPDHSFSYKNLMNKHLNGSRSFCSDHNTHEILPSYFHPQNFKLYQPQPQPQVQLYPQPYPHHPSTLPSPRRFDLIKENPSRFHSNIGEIRMSQQRRRNEESVKQRVSEIRKETNPGINERNQLNNGEMCQQRIVLNTREMEGKSKEEEIRKKMEKLEGERLKRNDGPIINRGQKSQMNSSPRRSEESVGKKIVGKSNSFTTKYDSPRKGIRLNCQSRSKRSNPQITTLELDAHPVSDIMKFKNMFIESRQNIRPIHLPLHSAQT